MPANPGSHEQLKFPAGRLRQRPWGPHTLDEMRHARFWVPLVATSTVQLSITLGGGERDISKFWSFHCFNVSLEGLAERDAA